MAADVSLDRAIEAVGHDHGTETRQIIKALRSLGVPCADRCKRLSKKVPVLPPRAMVVMRTKGKSMFHWMLFWDGVMYDPGNRYPNYDGWVMTSYLEILKK